MGSGGACGLVHIILSSTLYVLNNLLCFVCFLLILITICAMLILLERKMLAASQRRVGPTILGKRGFFQIIADVIKPLFKEVFEANSQALVLLTVSVFILLFTQLMYAAFFQYGVAASLYEDIEFVMFLQSFFGGLTTFSTLALGYLSKTRYGAMGSFRLVLTELSTEITTFISNTILLYTVSGLDYESLVLGQIDSFNLGIFGFIFGVVGLIQMFASAQRAPLDMIENEGELVAGYNTEYSGPDVLVIYFAEYFHLFNAGLQCIFLLMGGYCLFGMGDLYWDFYDFYTDLKVWEEENYELIELYNRWFEAYWEDSCVFWDVTSYYEWTGHRTAFV